MKETKMNFMKRVGMPGMTMKQDKVYDKKNKVKEGSKKDMRQDMKYGITDNKMMKKGKK